jgi:Fe2+ or Zn2+ uptake regulation protein
MVTKRRGESERVTAALAALDRAELRKTPQRVAIVRAFVDDLSHPTAQQIFERLHRDMPTMSFATVYNTLAALERAGVCRTLRLDGPAGDAGTRFDPMVEPHDHAVCDRCGAVRDVAADHRRARQQAGITGFRVHTVERIYRGHCDRCEQSK